MWRTIFVLAALLISSNSISASQITLKCTTDTGEKASDLTIDIENKEMMWGEYAKYDITHVNDTYISAYEKSTGVGGEVWVIDRVSGKYKRAAVGIYCANKCEAGDTKFLDAQIYEGRCVKQQF